MEETKSGHSCPAVLFMSRLKWTKLAFKGVVIACAVTVSASGCVSVDSTSSVSSSIPSRENVEQSKRDWEARRGSNINAITVQAGTLSAGRHHSCVLNRSKAVVCWGDNEYGQSDAPEGDFVDVSAASSHSCGLRTDGTVT